MRLPLNSYARRQKELTSIERDGAAFPPGDSHTTEKAVRDFRVQRVHKSPKNVSDDGLENAPPTRAGNRAQIRPVVGLISLWSQKLNSWRSAMDSNHQFELPSHAVTICTRGKMRAAAEYLGGRRVRGERRLNSPGSAGVCISSPPPRRSERVGRGRLATKSAQKSRRRCAATKSYKKGD